MDMRTMNGHDHADLSTRPGAQRPPDFARNGNGTAAGHLPPLSGLSGEALDTTELRRALLASQQKLEAALQQVDVLLRRDSLLKQRVVLLAQSLAKARHHANFDELTGLPNRTLLLDRFQQAVARGERLNKRVALLFLDLDGFKSINDSFGHVAGDRILQQVAARLAGCIRASDTACRYGGDEFVVILPELEGQESAIVALEKIRSHLGKPYFLDGAEIQLTASFGMAIYPIDGKDYGELVQISDVAMYRHKVRESVSPNITVTAPRR